MRKYTFRCTVSYIFCSKTFFFHSPKKSFHSPSKKLHSHKILAILNGSIVGTPAHAFLTRSLLTPIPKGKRISPHPNPLAIRPIAISETLTKIASLYALEFVKSELGKIFSSVQFGAGLPGGVNAAIIAAQLHLERDDSSFLILTDGRDSFQSRSRLTMWQALLLHAPLRPLLRIVHLLYAQPSECVVFDGAVPIDIITSVCGSRQGCVFGSILFDLSVQPSYESLAAAHNNLTFIAVHDDLTIAGSARDPASSSSALTGFAARCTRKACCGQNRLQP